MSLPVKKFTQWDFFATNNPAGEGKKHTENNYWKNLADKITPPSFVGSQDEPVKQQNYTNNPANSGDDIAQNRIKTVATHDRRSHQKRDNYNVYIHSGSAWSSLS